MGQAPGVAPSNLLTNLISSMEHIFRDRGLLCLSKNPDSLLPTQLSTSLFPDPTSFPIFYSTLFLLCPIPLPLPIPIPPPLLPAPISDPRLYSRLTPPSFLLPDSLFPLNLALAASPPGSLPGPRQRHQNHFSGGILASVGHKIHRAGIFVHFYFLLYPWHLAQCLLHKKLSRHAE